jgi:hypothetical protein
MIQKKNIIYGIIFQLFKKILEMINSSFINSLEKSKRIREKLTN